MEYPMRFAKRTDENHRAVVDGIRAHFGPLVSVDDLSGTGMGTPDIAAGYKGLNYLFEIKDPGKSASRRRLTPAQERWHAKWKGQVAVIHTAEEAIEIMTTQ
jgi:hypothetical protein